ncbi:MAG: RecQ family ATP-dependent DNA helicase [Spirochaetaceae bacterium]|jgi:ATP-dependent DNA helicase RecQ|nr:RecQ family ATP-dependent DNA helicase [Spirochaetaceae bacterium]
MENQTLYTDPIQEAARSLFGMDYLFPYQRLVVGNIMEAYGALSEKAAEDTDGGDADRATLGRQIVILPTGAGKSLCFQLPAMMLKGPTLVIYPILSLMADQERRLAEKNFSPVILRGGQSAEEREAIWRKLESEESRFIIANPEVLLTEKLLAKLPELGVVHIVIDEAHCVSEWGESFRPSYLEISRIIEAARAPLVTAFTATASAQVLEKIEKYIFGGSARAHRIVGNPDRPNISYAARGCVLRDLAVRDLLAVNEKPAIVFCSSRPGTERLARYLRNTLNCREIRFYHAGLEREEKDDVEKWFFSSAGGTLVATCAYGMGVDKSNIRTVIHRDAPPSVEAYLQESGRAGRDGALSRAYLLWGPEDEEAALRAPDAGKRRLEELFAYARDTESCRREKLLDLLNYEGENSKPESECCDVCAGGARGDLREERPVLEFFRRNRLVYDIAEAACVLAPYEEARWSGKEAKTVIQYLLKRGRLKQFRHFPWKGKLAPCAKAAAFDTSASGI